MATLSLGMIVKNEEQTLGRILAAARTVCDELVVVDTGSSDRTVAIAEALGAKVFSFPWVEDFAAARNYSFSKCTKDWVVWLDADDYLTADSCAAILQLKSGMFENRAIDMVFSPYHYAFGEGGDVRDRFDRERFVRRAAKPVWTGAVHETIVPFRGRCRRCPEAIVQHRTIPELQPRKKGRNLRIMRAHFSLDNSPLHDMYQFGCELMWNNEPTEALNIFTHYLHRQQGQPDPVGEIYLATIKAADLSHRGGDLDASLRLCLAALFLDSTRAEAPCLAGRFLLQAGRAAEAWSYLLMASCLPLPTHSPKHLFPWFYDHEARKDCLRAQQKLGPLDQQLAQLEGLKLTTVAALSYIDRQQEQIDRKQVRARQTK